jgi:hypothetical protein
VLYTAKCYWPGVTEEELRLAAAQADSQTREPQQQAVFRGALYLLRDELVLGVFESPARADVQRASDNAGMPCERVIETVWVAAHPQGGKRTCAD